MYLTKIRPHLIIGFCYTLLTLLLTYPVIFQLTSHIAGFQGEDNLQWRWFLWWFKHALLNLQTSPIHLSTLYAPTGGEQPFYAIIVFIPALALPLTLLSGPTLSFNFSFLVSFALTGYTTYLLAYYLTHHRPSAFIAGLIFAFYPARFGYATGTFLGQLTIYFLPLYLLALFMLAQRPNWPRVIWGTLVLACLCLTWPLHVVYGAVIFTVLFVIFQIPLWLRQPTSRNSLKYFGLMFGLTLILVLGFYLPLYTSFQRGDNTHLGGSDTTNFSIDLLAFITPSNYHPILQPLGLLPGYVKRVLTDYNDIQERLAYIGFVPTWLIGLALLKFRTRLLFWLLIALGAMLLSLGPLLKFNGNLVALNIDGNTGYVLLPYAILRAIPILDWSGVIGRLNGATMLCVAVLAAYGTIYLLKLVGSTRVVSYGLVALLTLLILFEYLTIFPFPTESDAVPEYYHQLKEEGAIKPQTIIDLPLVGEPFYNNYAMHYQTVHQQPIAGGHFMRKPAQAREMTAFLNQLLLPPLNQTVIKLPDFAARLGLLNKFTFTKIIGRLWLMDNEPAKTQLSYLASWLGQPYSTADVTVFDIPPGGTPAKVTTLLDGAGWQFSTGSNQFQLQAPANLLVYLDDPQQQLVTLQLKVSSEKPDRYLAVELDGRPALRTYLRQETLTYNTPVSLSPGLHQITMYPQESCKKDCFGVNFSHIDVSASKPASKAVDFQGQFTLLDYEVAITTTKPGQPILVYLYWQGQTDLITDYSAFVHLVAPTGDLIGQVDYLLGGTFSTSNWPKGYAVAMPSLIFVPPDTPPGEYQLRAGLYQTDTYKRLSPNLEDTTQDFTLLAKIRVMP